MKRGFVLSAFSPKMLSNGGTIRFSSPISGKPALELLRSNAEKLQPVGVGHPGAASLLSGLLARQVEVDRTPVSLNKGDWGYIVLAAGRLEPGRELNDNELAKLVIVYPFEVLEG